MVQHNSHVLLNLWPRSIHTSNPPGHRCSKISSQHGHLKEIILWVPGWARSSSEDDAGSDVPGASIFEACSASPLRQKKSFMQWESAVVKISETHPQYIDIWYHQSIADERQLKLTGHRLLYGPDRDPDSHCGVSSTKVFEAVYQR